MIRKTIIALLVTGVVLVPGIGNAATRADPQHAGIMCKPIGVEKTVCTFPGYSFRAGPIGPCIGGFGVQVFFLVVTERTTVTVGTKDQNVQASEPLVVLGSSGCMEGGHPGDQAGAPTFVSRLGLMF